ncbi:MULTISPECIES: carbohydrate ABC transporter permease [Microbacterium]|uniref:Carbohydrate ABC transporter permease n=1 Tax=Microbacterium sufflavum TaxID=2851649 RepID=A0ABY4ID90_9MICO|nr:MULTISPECIES: carbohydrate ABC transporter permease [Microbacterium]MBN6191474.1 carbohydrate ABC transporter permease [Aneurinibacillus sp. BA2021]MCK2025696.1 carbohydrate ABC transporter permease [Microbacterium sufflavum]UPL10544.1 carbohydrate ABC transporter permease [Microbacterium sufflavum]
MGVRQRKRHPFPWISYLVVAIGGVMMVVPFFDTVFSSLKGPGEYGIFPYRFFPENWTWDNYTAAFEQLQLDKLFFNSTVVTLVVTASVLITSAMAGYALAKLRFRGRDVIFRFVLATMMLPPFLLLIPDFLIMLNWPLVGGNNILGQGGFGGMTNNIVSLMLPFLVSGFGIFLMRQFMVGVPDEMLEAARIDGAGEWRLFFNIVLPQATPVAITLGVITFVGQWNEYIWSSLIASANPDLMTLPVGIQMLQSFIDPNRTMPIVMAGIVISTLPVLLIFLFLQKYYVRGVMLSGMK